MAGIGDFASKLFVGPGGENLTGTEKAVRVALSLAAASQNPAGLISAHEAYQQQNDAVMRLMQSPEFAHMSPERQAQVLPRGYNLPQPGAAPPVPLKEEAEWRKSNENLATADNAKKMGDYPTYYRSLGANMPDVYQGQEAANAIRGARDAGLEPTTFGTGPGGVSMEGEVPGERRELSSEEIDALAANRKATGLGPGFTLEQDQGHVYLTKESPAMRKRREIAKITADAEVDKASRIIGAKAEDDASAISDFITYWKDMAKPEAFALQVPAKAAMEGNRAWLRDFINHHGPETTWSAPRQRFLAAVNSSLDEIQRRYGGSKGAISDKDIERARAGLTEDGISQESVLQRIESMTTILAIRRDRATGKRSADSGTGSGVEQPMAGHGDDALKAKLRAAIEARRGR